MEWLPADVPSCTSWEHGEAIDDTDAWIGLARTKDGGKSWQAGRFSAADTEKLGLDPLDTKYEGPSLFSFLVRFSDLDVGWLTPVTPKDGGTWRTSDGGITWERNGAPNIDAMAMAGERRMWSATSGSPPVQPYESLDLGSTWKPIGRPVADVFLIEKPYFLDAQRGWAVMFGSQCEQCTGRYWIGATTDGGRTWLRTELTPMRLGDPAEFYFVDPKLGWLAGGEAGLLRTTDGGRQWEQIALPAGAVDIRSVFFGDRTNGWILDRSGDAFRSTDEGRSWLRMDRDSFEKAAPIRAKDGRRWGRGGLLKMLRRSGC